MRRVAPFLLSLSLVAGCSSQPPLPDPSKPWTDVLDAKRHHTITGTVRLIPALSVLGRERRVWLYLPPGYAESKERYPVLYMHDGQNLFDQATAYAGEWGVDETLEELIAAKKVPPMIVVGIDNGGQARMDEYVPFKTKYGQGGEADAYVAWLIKELKPQIDGAFRTKSGPESTWIGGSSLGGYISLWAGLHHPEVFGGILAFSTPFDLGDGAAVIREAIAQRPAKPQRYYLDIGQLEEEPAPGIVALNQDVTDRIGQSGVAAADRTLVVDPAGVHNEGAWRRRFPKAIEWLTAHP
ncbi:MAG TPA: alpha/beta hydrolase-fold protein [Symbiobacteriaceae bacterium]|nr:alpha/beta hydrolase-fold protein [Symbiobacteriaceae bacterium]